MTASDPARRDPYRSVAEQYVKLVLAVGQHDGDYVDAFYGPAEWRTEAETAKKPLADDRCAGGRDRSRAGGVVVEAGACRRGDVGAAPAISDAAAAALRSRVAMLQGKKLTSMRSRSRSTTPSRPTKPESEFAGGAGSSSSQAAGRGPLIDRYDRFKQAFVIPTNRRRPRVPGSDPRAAANACRRSTCRSGALHGRVRHQQVVERLQLVSGEYQEPDPGQHRPADLHRSRDRSRVPRRLPGSSRLQRAARKEPGQGSRLDRIHGLSAVLAAIADRRGHGQLRHRGGVFAAGSAGVRARRAVSDGGTRSRKRVVEYYDIARPRGSTVVCGQ